MYQLYYGNISLGDPQNLQGSSAVMFDTQSQISTVPAVNCSGCPGNWFNVSNDPNAVIGSTWISQSYGEQVVNGPVIQANVTCIFGDAMNNSLYTESNLACVEGLDVLMAESASNPKLGEYDAVLGLGQP